MSGKKWSEHETGVMLQHYVTGGPAAVKALLPDREIKQITQKAWQMDIQHKPHLAGRRNGGRRRKPDAECAPYKPSPAEQAKLLESLRLCGELRDFAYITHKGQLRPMVRVELEAA
jgi:hypothetical protein